MEIKPNMYKVYSKIASLACSNVRSEICAFNMFKGSEVTVQVRGKDNVVSLTADASTHPKTAIADYSKKADKLLVIRSVEPTIKMLTAGRIFIESILSSRNSRLAQKRLIEYGAAERFLGDAYVYDSKHQVALRGSAMTKAKNIVAKELSLVALGYFDFDRGRPHIDKLTKADLEKAAFDPKFSFMSKQQLESMIDKKYEELFADKTALFAKVAKAEVNKNVEKIEKVKKMPPIQSKETPITSRTLMLDQLWNKQFAQLSLSNRIRKFVNLKVRNNDIFKAPKPVLIRFRQMAAIEAMTKRQFILDYYIDTKPADYEDSDMERYLFRQENNMYKYMWDSGKSVKCDSGRLYFPDGSNMVIPGDMTPYEFFHKVNAVYAALFGFTEHDAKGSDNWLYDAVRRAYTEEGMADYRLGMINKKLEALKKGVR